MKLYISIILILSCIIHVSFADETQLKQIISEIAKQEIIITNVSFNYNIDCNISEAWRNRRMLRILKKVDDPDIRISEIEHTIRFGSAVFATNRFKISSTCVAVKDGKLFHDFELLRVDTNSIELNFVEKAGYIREYKSNNFDLTFDPRNFPLLGLDGQSLYATLNDSNAETIYKGMQLIDDVNCYFFELRKCFKTPRNEMKQVKREIWIAPEKGFLIKKIISYSVDHPEKPVSITCCEFEKCNANLWYYSTVVFKSYPLYSSSPDIVSTLQLANITINRLPDVNDFTVELSRVENIYDTLLKLHYKTVKGMKFPSAISTNSVIKQ